VLSGRLKSAPNGHPDNYDEQTTRSRYPVLENGAPLNKSLIRSVLKAGAILVTALPIFLVPPRRISATPVAEETTEA
jgi:hypothetical protein